MINQCVLVGKVVREPEIRTTPKGNTIAHMLVEADRSFRNEDGSLSSAGNRVREERPDILQL